MFRKIVLPSLLVIVALFAISLGATTPVHGQLVGVVCIAAPPVTTTSGCPSTPANVAGGAAGTKFVVAINIQGSDALNGFRIFVKTDNTIINPVKADTNNTILAAPLLILANCINGAGTGCSLSAGDGPGVVDVGVVSLTGLTSPPTTGNLFEIVYQVVTATNGTPINFLTSSTTSGTCPQGSSVPGVCVTITNGGSQPNVETAQTGIAINLASFALSATSGNLTITAGSSKTSTVTVSSVLSGIGTVTLSSAVTPVKTNGPTATLGTLSGTLSNRVTSFTSLLTVSTVAATPGGNYNVTVTGVCPTSGCSVTTRNLIIPVVIPAGALTVDFASSPATPEVGSTVTFTATTVGGSSPFSYLWTFGDGTTATTTTNIATHSYTTASTFSATVQVTDSLSHVATSPAHNVVVAARLTAAAFTFTPASPEAGSPVQFTATTTGGVAPFTFSWSFGDATTGTGSPVSHSYSAAGTFSVTVTATDANSVSATSPAQNVVVAARLTAAAFTFTPTTPEVGVPVQFTATTTGGVGPFTFSWNFGDTTTGTGSPVSHSYTAAGTFSVTVTATDANGVAVTSPAQNVVVAARLSAAAFTFTPSSPEAAVNVQFTATTTGGVGPFTFSWNFGDTATGTGNPVSHSYTAAGTFRVTVTATDANGVSVTSPARNVIVAPRLSAAAFTFTPSTPEAGSPVQFTASTTGGVGPFTFSWSFGDTTTGTGSPVSHSYAAAGTFSVSVTATDANGGSVTSPVQKVVVAARLYAAAFTFTPATPEAGLAVSFTATTTGGVGPFTFSWNFGDTPTGTGNPASHSYSAAGTFSVTVTATDSNGVSVTSPAQSVVVAARLSAANFTFTPVSPEVGVSVQFTATTTGGVAPFTFSWNFGGTTTGTGSPVSHSYTAAGTFSVTVTATDANGVSVASPAQNVEIGRAS